MKHNTSSIHPARNKIIRIDKVNKTCCQNSTTYKNAYP